MKIFRKPLPVIILQTNNETWTLQKERNKEMVVDDQKDQEENPKCPMKTYKMVREGKQRNTEDETMYRRSPRL